MKKFISIVICVLLIIFGVYYAYFQRGVYFDFGQSKNVSSDYTVVDKTIYVDKGNGPEAFEIRGVDMGTGYPELWSTDFGIEKEVYLDWFKQIKEMGANTVRIYTINPVGFYEALAEYNADNEDPLYIIQGVWIDENVMNSHCNAFDSEFIDTFITDCKMAVDVIHGNRTIKISESKNIAEGDFRDDVSKWVIGYIIGVEWESSIISYTNDENADNENGLPYDGKYIYSTSEATPFENMLAKVGDSLIDYETKKYGCQRLLAYSNWPNTDPFEYNLDIIEYMRKYESVDVEHIKTKDNFLAGQFASYHIYPYYPNYINYMDDWSVYGIDEPKDYIINGQTHSYEAYLKALVNHHSMPVIISEFGVPSSRGIAAVDTREGHNQGGLSEQEQADIVVECYKEIMEAGCAGSCVFSWQDEWFKHAWNTLYSSDIKRSVFWSDYQTVEQAFGLVGYDTGYKDNCYNDETVDEWKDSDLVISSDDIDLYMRNDEKYVYFRIHNENMNFNEDTYYIPVDVTPKSGSTTVKDTTLSFDRDADFLITINGENNSDIRVQKRYEAISSTLSNEVYGYDTYLKENIPEVDTDEFVQIKMGLQEPLSLIYGKDRQATISTFITGDLTYGNGNPNSENYLSNSDFYCNGKDIEIRIPWALLNFSDPSLGEIHNDYYRNYGIDYLKVSYIYAGIGIGDKRIDLGDYKLDVWNETVDVHEYKKAAYYALKDIWSTTTSYNSQRSETVERTVTVKADYSVPAIMYHDFIKDDVDESHIGEYAIYESEFENDLIYLQDHGYTTLDTQDVLDIKAGKMEMPDKPIILTIDDGRYGVYNVAYPLLVKYNMKAVLTTIGTFIDDESIASIKDPDSFAYRTYSFCTWDEIAEMGKSGNVEIISHTYGLHDYDLIMGGMNSEEWGDLVTSDVLKLKDTYVRKNINYNANGMSYPLSIRSRSTDQKIFEMGYQVLYTGEIYEIRKDLKYTYTSKYGSSDEVYLIPRAVRLHDVSIYSCIVRFNSSVYNVKYFG